MEPEPERSLAKLASRREAKEEDGRDGSKAARLYFISAAVDDAASKACASRAEEAAEFSVPDDEEGLIGRAEREDGELRDARE